MIKRAQANELWTELFNKKGSQWLPVLTGSMSPLIHAGDQVLVARIIPEKVCTGDIVVFRRGDNIIVHRALRKRKTNRGIRFNEKGDGTYSSGRFFADDLIGRVITVKRGDKILRVSSPCGRLASFTLGVWLYGSTVIITALRSSRKKTVRKIGKHTSRLFLFFSNTLIRTGSLIWFLSGLIAKRRVMPNQKQAVKSLIR